MSTKTSADVLIGGKIYTLSGYESEAYLQQVAAYINSKINEFDEMESYKRLPPDMKAALLELNIADDYFKAKEKADQLSLDLEVRDKEIYELKHDFISSKMKLDDKEKEIYQLEKELRELKLLKSKLESSLEEALLGKIKGFAPVPEVEAKEEPVQQIHINELHTSGQKINEITEPEVKKDPEHEETEEDNKPDAPQNQDKKKA